MTVKRRRYIVCMGVLAGPVLWWVFLAPWPDPVPAAMPWTPDTILILGGGDAGRARQGLLLAGHYPDALVIVSGDGGWIMRDLLKAGVLEGRIIHEEKAESTMDNARLTAAALAQRQAGKVVLVTNWFHAPRALAVFRREQPSLEFCVSFEKKPEPLPVWDRNSQRRERMAAIWYLLRYGIWSW